MATKSVQANWILDRLKEIEDLAKTVKVIPVHRDRFLMRACPLKKLNQMYRKSCSRDLALRVHDFSKGPVFIGQHLSIGYGVFRFRK